MHKISSDVLNLSKKLKRYIKYSYLSYLSQAKGRLLSYYLERASPLRGGTIRHSLPGKLVVSLTSYPKRFGVLHLTIKSLLRQKTQPDKIILWIAEVDKKFLPDKVLDLQKSGLTIAYCEDIRSYKKLIPSIKMFPDCFIVTADDDIYFHPNWLEYIVSEYSNDSKTVISSRAHRIKFDDRHRPLLYRNWDYEKATCQPSLYNFPTTGAGVLYPPYVFHPSVLDVDSALRLCPDCDDVWFYWMLIINGAKIKKIQKYFLIIEWNNTQDCTLWMGNVYSGGNDRAIAAMYQTYGFPHS